MVIKVKGLDSLDKRVSQLSGVELYPIIKEMAQRVQRTAKNIAPVDTGRLRGSIRQRTFDVANPYARVGTVVEYAIFQEFGTSKAKPQPFLRPALRIEEKVMRMLISKAVKDKMKQVSK
jgi:HK97 gp10 family phage protein